MFIKEDISFQTKEIFYGFKPLINECFCIVSSMLFNEIINPDGTIDFNRKVSVKELWSYIYYIYFYNNRHIPEFISMTNKKTNKASAKRFFEVVKLSVDLPDAKTLSSESLVLFIDRMIHTKKKEIMIPIVIYLQKILDRSIIPAQTISFKKVKNSNTNVEIITEKSEIENSDIVLRVNKIRKSL